jgi:RNA polymerase sigma-70 factor (ECF subfamily)
VQRYLDLLVDERQGSAADPIVRDLLASAVNRLHFLCASMLYRRYPRLTRPPLNLDAAEMLGAVVERLLKAMREARPGNVRQFFALANCHVRWELNDLAKRLDEQGVAVEATEESLAAPEVSDGDLSANLRRILDAIEALPQEEREVFDLVRVQGLMQTEVAEMLGVSTKTVQRRLNKGLLLLSEQLSDLRLGDGDEPAS